MELYEAAKMDGAGDFRIYWEIILPLIRPVLSALAIFSFLGAFNAYLWPLVALNDQDLYTLPLDSRADLDIDGGDQLPGDDGGITPREHPHNPRLPAVPDEISSAASRSPASRGELLCPMSVEWSLLKTDDHAKSEHTWESRST